MFSRASFIPFIRSVTQVNLPVFIAPLRRSIVAMKREKALNTLMYIESILHSCSLFLLFFHAFSTITTSMRLEFTRRLSLVSCASLPSPSSPPPPCSPSHLSFPVNWQGRRKNYIITIAKMIILFIMPARLPSEVKIFSLSAALCAQREREKKKEIKGHNVQASVIS